jgi:hypothetical protein
MQQQYTDNDIYSIIRQAERFYVRLAKGRDDLGYTLDVTCKPARLCLQRLIDGTNHKIATLLVESDSTQSLIIY